MLKIMAQNSVHYDFTPPPSRQKIETMRAEMKKLKVFFARPKLKYSRGFERAQPFDRCAYFQPIFHVVEAI